MAIFELSYSKVIKHSGFSLGAPPGTNLSISIAQETQS